MKKIFALLLSISVTFGLAAQDTEAPEIRRNEIYLKPTGLFNFSGLQLEYKRQLKSGKYWTFGVDDLSINYSKDLDPAPSTTSFQNSYNIRLSTGIEKRKNITGALDFISGPNISLGYSYAINQSAYTDPAGEKTVSSMHNTTYSVGPGYKFGLLYTFKERLLVGGQFIPTLAVQYRTDYNKQTPGPSPTNTNDDLLFNFNLFNNSRLLIGYKF